MMWQPKNLLGIEVYSIDTDVLRDDLTFFWYKIIPLEGHLAKKIRQITF